MRGKFNSFLFGALLGALLIILILFADDIRKFIGRRDWIMWLLLIVTVINTSLIIYILRLTKNDTNKDDNNV